MRTKRSRREMTTADQAADLVRPNMLNAVAALRERGYSKMQAYSAIGRDMGRSVTWLRKVIGRQPDAFVGFHDFLNLSEICSRLESATALNNRIADEIRDSLNADAQTSDSVVAVSAVSDPSSPRRARATKGARS